MPGEPPDAPKLRGGTAAPKLRQGTAVEVAQDDQDHPSTARKPIGGEGSRVVRDDPGRPNVELKGDADGQVVEVVPDA